MSERDPFEVLKLLDPFKDEMSEPNEALLLRIVETPVTSKPRRRRRAPIVVGGVVMAGVLATAAFAVLREERAPDPVTIGCYAGSRLDGDRAVLGASLNPVASCEALWFDGTFATDGPPEPLVGCVTDSGVAVVFPGGPTGCSRLGLAELVPGRTDEQQAIVELQELLAETFSTDCFDQDESLAKAQELLDASGLEGWTVQLAEDFPPQFDCGGAGPLADAKTVLVGGDRPAP